MFEFTLRQCRMESTEIVLKAMERTVVSTLRSYSAELYSLSENIRRHPEEKFEERHAHDRLTAFLEKENFIVRTNYKSLPGGTAFRAEYTTVGYNLSVHPTIAVICEYDALPESGHACGHNLIAESGVATGLAVRDVFKNHEDVRGKIVVMGTPGEEGGGGKCYLLARGAFADIDFAMMVHPFANNDLKPVILGAHACNIYFHSNVNDNVPSTTCRPMDAAVQLYQHIDRFRSKFQIDWRIHGVINPGKFEKGSSMPKTTHSWYMVRAVSQKDFRYLQQRLQEFAEAAAQSTGCRLDFQWVDDMVAYAGMVHNSAMAEMYREYSEKDGVVYPKDVKPFYGSTDMGNVSLVVPSIHPGFSLGKEVMIHTREFEQLAGSEEAQKWTLVAAKSMAMSCVRLFTDDGLRERVKKEFLNSQIS